MQDLFPFSYCSYRDPVGVGASFANKVKKNGKITVVFGDGAIDEGVLGKYQCRMFNETSDYFVCEDNGLAVHIG